MLSQKETELEKKQQIIEMQEMKVHEKKMVIDRAMSSKKAYC